MLNFGVFCNFENIIKQMFKKYYKKLTVSKDELVLVKAETAQKTFKRNKCKNMSKLK